MSTRTAAGLLVLSLIVAVGSGCCSRSRSFYSPYARYPVPPAAGIMTVPAAPPRAPAPCPNGGPLAQLPPTETYRPPLPPAQPLPAAPLNPAPFTPDQQGERWLPPSLPKLYGPEPEPEKPSVEPNVPPPSYKPDTNPDRPPVSPLPVGIPGFAEVRKGISNGLRPNSIDGLDWLAGSGYKTVLHLREPGQDDASDRKQFESRGLRYIVLDVSPDNLTADTVDRFNRVVGDLAGQPLFVYDRDGMLTGGLWYLHFRLVEGSSDADALSRASRLGLKTDPSGGHRRMLLAVQKFLSQQGK